MRAMESGDSPRPFHVPDRKGESSGKSPNLDSIFWLALEVFRLLAGALLSTVVKALRCYGCVTTRRASQYRCWMPSPKDLV
jgi:hypothetical protein